MKIDKCPFCVRLKSEDEYSVKIVDLSVSTLRLNKIQTYKGYCLLIFKNRHVTGLEQLTNEEYSAFMADLKLAANVINNILRPTLMNYASLGNVIPHLHFHIIPRYENDIRFGKPIWTTHEEDMTQHFLSDKEFEKLKQDLKYNQILLEDK